MLPYHIYSENNIGFKILVLTSLDNFSKKNLTFLFSFLFLFYFLFSFTCIGFHSDHRCFFLMLLIFFFKYCLIYIPQNFSSYFHFHLVQTILNFSSQF